MMSLEIITDTDVGWRPRTAHKCGCREELLFPQPSLPYSQFLLFSLFSFFPYVQSILEGVVIPFEI
jgi:hypothetical protein